MCIQAIASTYTMCIQALASTYTMCIQALPILYTTPCIVIGRAQCDPSDPAHYVGTLYILCWEYKVYIRPIFQVYGTVLGRVQPDPSHPAHLEQLRGCRPHL